VSRDKDALAKRRIAAVRPPQEELIMMYHASACAALCLLAVGAAASPGSDVVSAGPDKIVRSVRVPLTGGTQSIEQQLRAAARHVCRTPDGDRVSWDSLGCYHAALADARARVAAKSQFAAGAQQQMAGALR